MKIKEIWTSIKDQFILWLARRLPDCKPMTKMFSDSLDQPVSLRERVTMRLHLYTCEACRRYRDNVKFMHDSFRHIERVPEETQSKTALSDETRERIKAALESASRKP